jgi:hypothetical protein
MTDWQTAENAYLDELATRPAARPPATIGEIWSASWGAAGLDTMFGSHAVTDDALREYREAVEHATGKSLVQLAGEQGRQAAIYAGHHSEEDEAAVLGAALGTVDPETRQHLVQLSDYRKRAAEKAALLERRAADVGEGTYTFGGQAVSFIAGLARVAVDPVNLVTTVFGGPLKGPVLKMLGREALIGAGAQAIQEPAIETERARLGLESGLGRAAANIGMAAGGAAGLSLVFRGAAAGLRRLRGSGERPPPLDGVTPEDFDAAALHAERDELVDALAAPPTPAGRARSAEKVDAAAVAIEGGRTLAEDTAPAPAIAGDIFGPPRPDPTLTFQPKRIVYFDGARETIIRPGGARMTVRPAVIELSDLIVSHSIDGKPNASYPAALQPRDREAAASRSFIAERAAELEPELLGASPTAAEGAPIAGPDGVIESGNGRTMMIARAYDRHPERAAAYRGFLEQQGYDLEGFEFPVLVRIREGDLADRAAFAREANISPIAGMSARERAFADAKRLDDHMLALWQPGETSSLANAKFVRAFAERVVAPEERPQFVSADNRLSADGAARVEAALVARAWGEQDIVSALYEAAAPTSKAILGALADTAPMAARLKLAIAEDRVPAASDVTGDIIAAFRIVERARAERLPATSLLDQVDLERGAVPEKVRRAAELFFREDKEGRDPFFMPAGRELIAARIDAAIGKAIDQQNAVGDLFGGELDSGGILRAAKLAGEDLGDQVLPPPNDLVSAESFLRQPFETIDELYVHVAAHQAELDTIGKAIAAELGIEFKTTGPKARATAEAKLARKGYKSAAQLTDVVRAGLVVATPDQADQAIALLTRHFDVLDEGWVRTPAGYLDRKAMVRFADGMVGEVQFWEPNLFAAKKASGSKLYTEARALDARDPRHIELNRQMEELYSAALASAAPAWAVLGRSSTPNLASKVLRQLSSRSTRPLSATSAGLTRVQGSPGARTAKAAGTDQSMTAGRSSQLTKTIGASPDPEISASPAEGKGVVGDPAIASEATRILDEAGGDFEIVVPGDDGTPMKVSARASIAEAEEDAAAAGELFACIGATAARETAA